MQSFLKIILLTVLLLHTSVADPVCDERLLLMELRQDIEDNGVLDCLRIVQPPHSYSETIEEKNKRIAAQWDTDCSFEAEYDWMKSLREIHGINNLVDDTGDIVERDFDDQADMCEIIRAALAAGKFSKVTNDLANIPLKVLDLIDCPGAPEQSEICAVSGSSFFQKDSWTILLDGLGLAIDKKPRYVIAPDAPTFPEIPEVQKDVIKAIESAAKRASNGLINSLSGALRAGQGLTGAFNQAANMLAGFQKPNGAGGKEEPKVDDKEKVSYFATDNRDCTRLQNTNKFDVMKNMYLKANSAKEKILIGFGSTFGVFENPCHLVTRMMVDGVEQLDTRTLCGNHGSVGTVSAFVTKVKAGEHKVNLDYRTPCNLKAKDICPGTQEYDNNNVGYLMLDATELKFYKRIAAAPINVAASQTWVKMPEMEVEFTLEKKKTLLMFYNVAFQNNDDVFVSRLNVEGGKGFKTSLTRVSTQPYIGAFGWAVATLDKNRYKVVTEYTLTKGTTFNPTTADWQSAGVSIVELPDSVKYHEKSLGSLFTLSPGGWSPLNDVKLTLTTTKQKLLLFFYNIACPLSGGKPIHAKVVVDGNDSFPSRSSSTDKNQAGLIGQGFVKLTPGSHEIVLQYKTETPEKVDPMDQFQHAALFGLEFEME